MTPTPSRPIFSKAVTWIGVVILATGLSAMNQPLALANAGMLHTSSMQWSGISTNAVLSGGTPRDFVSGDRGWGSSALESAGLMGLEWETHSDPAMRTTYYSNNHSLENVPGGESTFTAIGYMTPDSSRVVQTHISTRVSGNQAQWSLRLQSLSPEVMEDLRFFWEASLPSGYNSVFHTPDPNTLVISDSSGTHPTLVLTATSSAGTTGWGGAGIFSQQLTNGDKSPTFYLHQTIASNIYVTITLGVIDHDPCSQVQALAFAGDNIGTYAQAWEPVTSCLASPQWQTLVSGEAATNYSITLDSRVGELEPHQTRVLTISGLPEGVTWSRLPEEGFTLVISISSLREVAEGDYPLVFGLRTRTDNGDTVEWSEPLQTSGVLTIEAGPEPEPEPEPDPEPESEPALKPDEELEPDEPSTTEDDAPEDTEAEPLADEEPEMQEVIASEVPSSQTDQPSAVPALSVGVGAPAPRVFVAQEEPPSVTEVTEPVFVPHAPIEKPLDKEPENVDHEATILPIPEPSVASAWVGALLLAATGISGMYAILRRRRADGEE